MTVKTPEEITAENKTRRDAIKVESMVKTEEEVEAAKVAEAEAAAEAEEKAEDDKDNADDKNEENLDDKKDEVKDSKQTEEELQAAKDAAKTDREKDKFQKRIDREVAKRKALETEIKELKAKLATDPEKAATLTEEEVEKRAESKATAKQLQRDFDNASNRLFDAAVKLDKDFQKKITLLADDIGAIPGHLVGILDDLDNGGDVLVHFTANPDDAEEIYQLSPARAAVKLAKLSAKLEAEKKPKPKEISKVPDPAETIKGGNKNPDTLPKNPTSNMDEFVRIRAKQREENRKAKLGLH